MVNETKTDLEAERRKFDREQEQNTDKLHDKITGALDKAITLKERGGKTYLFGFEVDPKFGSLLRAGFDLFTPKITEFGAPVAGKWFKAVASALPKNTHITPEIADKTGQAAFLWSTVFVNQLTDLTSHASEYREHRQELFKEFKPVMEATGAKLGANEVMLTEYERANKNFWTATKAMGADVVTLVPKILIAKEQHDGIFDKPKFKLPTTKAGEVKEHPMTAELNRQLAALPPGHFEDAEHRAEWIRNAKDEISRQFGVGRKLETPSGEVANQSLLNVAAGLSPFINAYVKEGDTDKSATAWEMIKKLRAEVDNVCTRKGSDCEFAPPEPDRIRIDGEALPEYLVQVFQQNEKNRGRGEIAGVNLERLQEASQIIAEGIANGTLDAESLVVLVGEHKVIQHGKNGETTIAAEEDLQASIEQISSKIGKKIELTADEFFKAFTNKDVIRQEIASDLKSLHGMEKSCFVALLPDEVLQQAGMKETDYRKERAQARDHMYSIVEGYVQNLAKVAEESTPEQLRDMGLTKKNIATIKKLVAAMNDSDKDQALQSVVDGHHKEVLAIIATVMLNEQKETGGSFTKEWTQFVGQSSKRDKTSISASSQIAETGSEENSPEAKGFAGKATKQRGESVLAMGAGGIA